MDLSPFQQKPRACLVCARWTRRMYGPPGLSSVCEAFGYVLLARLIVIVIVIVIVIIHPDCRLCVRRLVTYCWLV